jgi:hypothetical protein
MALNHLPSLSKPHSRPACHMIWKLYCVGIFMAPCRMPPQSHPHLNTSAPKAEPGHAELHSLLHHFHDQLSLVLIFLHPSWCDLHSDTRAPGSCLSSQGPLVLCFFHPRSTLATAMPHLRGKAKRGAAWYAARGREPPNSDPPPETEGILPWLR